MSASELRSAQVRQPLLRGRQPVAALWFANAWLDRQAREARMLACWRSGASAWRFAQGDLLRYATASDENCEVLTGWPLRQEGRTLCSAPLRDQERKLLPLADVWIVLGSEVLAFDLNAGMALDPAEWLEVQQLSLHETYDCSAVLPAPEIVDAPAQSLRQLLGEALPPNRGRDEFLGSLREATPTAGGARGFWHYLLRRSFEVSQQLLNRWPAAHQQETAPDTVPPRQTHQGAPRWRQWLARSFMAARLSQWLARAHARYLERLLRFFDEGNLHEALRHAVPLSEDGLGDAAASAAFGTLSPRQSLELSRGPKRSAQLEVGTDLFRHLRQLYRRAFEKLDRAGRIDEAVFVLAELLGAKQEALDYLERHERFAQAAELALAWDLPAAVIVRLHCLAGNWRRAVAVARRDRAFATTILLLEKRWPEVALRLREEWARTLVLQGDWLGAVEAVWPILELRLRAAEWLQMAERDGGQLAARALVLRAALLPDTLERYDERLRELQRDRSLWRERVALAEALLTLERAEAPEQLVGVIAPGLLADHAEGCGHFSTARLQQLVELSGDALLRADLPNKTWPGVAVRPLSERVAPLHLEVHAAGTHAILDAMPLFDQRTLVALGEAGARVVDADGRVLAQFAVPAERLVISHSRQVALALARREARWRVSRLDLVQQSIVDLGLAELDRFVNRFDGLHWTVVQGSCLRVLDTQRSLREVVWQVTDLPGRVVKLNASVTREQVWLVIDEDRKQEQLWTYELPERRLLARTDLPPSNAIQLLNPAGGVVDVPYEHQEGGAWYRWQLAGRDLRIWIPAPYETHLSICADWFVIKVPRGPDFLVHWVGLATGVECVRAKVTSADWPHARAVGDHCLMFDPAGWLLGFDAATGLHYSCVVR